MPAVLTGVGVCAGLMVAVLAIVLRPAQPVAQGAADHGPAGQVLGALSGAESDSSRRR